MNYRIEASKKAGFSKFPDKLDAFLEYAKAMKAQGTPGGFALGHASGDGNSWVHWCLWSNGGKLVDKNDKVTSTRRKPPRRWNTPRRCTAT